jgi:diadenosine tetraphosphate (Ap4A) HIT family hydrolase
MADCSLCAGPDGDAAMLRVQVWEDDLWRLTTSVGPGDVTLGFSYLEPKRHVSDITALDGAEAATFGPVLARCTAALKEATGCELVYVYVFGGSIPHLHVHLAPHSDGDALNDDLIKGEFETVELDNGAIGYLSKDFPALSVEDCTAVADKVRQLLAQ